jgi:hypothetical protein
MVMCTRYKNPTDGDVYSIQHYVIKFVSDLQQVDQGFSPGNSTNKSHQDAITETLLKVVLNTITLTRRKWGLDGQVVKIA